jgi:hypothetical protein
MEITQCLTENHDVIHDTFDGIAWNVGFHVGRKWLHELPSAMFNFFYQKINIMFINDGIYTLVDIVITNLTHTNLFPQSCTTQRFTMSNIAQTKQNNYHNRHLKNIWMFTQIV